MKLVWLAVNSSFSHASLALPLLHAATRERTRATWQAVQATTKDDVGAVTSEVARHSPDVLAASLYLFNRRFVLDVAGRIKALFPAVRVILGGPECLGDNEPLLRREPAVDSVLRGEGEIAFTDWLTAVETGTDTQAVPGLCWLDGHSRCRDNGTARPVANLDTLPAAMDSAFFDWTRPFVQIETSRGCSNKCTFCTSADSAPVRLLPLPRVAEQLREVRRRGVREVRILDRTFNANPKRCVALLRLFRDEFPDLRFHLEIHPHLLTAAGRTELAAAPPGHLHIEAGLQTLCRPALRSIRRQTDTRRSKDGVQFLCQAPNLAVHVDLLAGLPGQALADVLADVDWLTAAGPQEIQLEVVKILPGTALRTHAAELGLAFAPSPPYDVLQTPHLSTDDLAFVSDLSRVVDGFYNHAALQPATRLAAQTPRFYADLVESLRRAGTLATTLSLERRFRLFHDFAAPRNLPVRERLEYDWLRVGLSPTHGLAKAQPWKTALPREALLVDGDAQSATRRDSRVWRLSQSSRVCWFVFDRHSTTQHQAAAIFALQ
ncbi:MAG: hypothetical protein A3K19_23685 [Lentisphaerae bacterium RIFOXYB12_FULL_65_16]|nr:MAG: hypothetical protein A3K18_18680 [Lentisphaerae bacterium RIFOXYA12_64_32]OGV94112.1 MAG: hypothetical protein A3K19_23685 [Lentisphaerae bacterium RIFOXYB12_FULL_65_16]